MKLSISLGQLPVPGRRFATPRGCGPAIRFALELSPASLRLERRAKAAFTLIELLVVVAIIAILAALTLSTLGYVNKKGADSRARAEVAALSAAIESYKLDNGAYPAAVAQLYTALCPTDAGAKVYFEPTPTMLATNGGAVVFADPWGTPYGYSNAVTFFDLWSTAGGTNTNNYIRN